MKTNVLVVIALLFSAISVSAEVTVRVKGNGKLTTKKISVENYNEIQTKHVMDVFYEQNESTPYVEVTVDQNLHEYVSIEVKNRVLILRFKGAKVDHFTKFIVKTNSQWLKEAVIRENANFTVKSKITSDETTIKANENSLIQFLKPIEASHLTLDVTGSANMVINELTVQELDCNIEGSGSVTLKKGTADEADYRLNSGGDLHAFGVKVTDVDCKMIGSSTAEVYAVKDLDVSMVGNSLVRYKGNPFVETTTLGKGRVEKVE